MNDEMMTRAQLHRETGCTSDCRRNGCPDDEVCTMCGGSEEVMIESGAGDTFTQSMVPCECVLTKHGSDEDRYIDMSGATPGDR